MRSLIMLAALSALMGCSTSSQRQESLHPLAKRSSQSTHLSSGTYKFSGHCSRMTVLANDVTNECGSSLGIIATDPDRTIFVIPLKAPKSAWEYQIASPGTTSEDGHTVSYSVSSMTASAPSIESSRQYVNPGECLMSTRAGEPLLRCTMWLDSTRHEIISEVIFEGNGSWAFNRATPNH
jgi:hypothetical protein